jgi:hypothetical protein
MLESLKAKVEPLLIEVNVKKAEEAVENEEKAKSSRGFRVSGVRFWISGLGFRVSGRTRSASSELELSMACGVYKGDTSPI